jgi:cob(I)alamin adenosyltransferase
MPAQDTAKPSHDTAKPSQDTVVRLDRIYTRGGDEGATSLGDGTRVAKHHLRVAAYGTVDELDAVLGLAVAGGIAEPCRGYIVAIQNDLFDVGADLCVPGTGTDRLRVTAAYTRALEEIIDRENARLAPLKSFILSGGTPHAAWLHLARNVCRRAERIVSELMSIPAEKDRVNAEVLRYLNRLSDLLFVLGRVQNGDGKLDVLWKPGLRRG